MKNKETKIYNLNTMLNYNNNSSVVSKTILRKNTGTITMFAFDANEGLAEHVVSYDAYLYIVEGAMKAIVADKEKDPIYCVKGDMVYMPADVPHAVEATESCKMFLIMIKSQNR